jgi:hypothetical protein
MPPKPKRLPAPALSHLKHSRQLFEDFLYQYLPQLSSMGSISRLNLYCWFSSRWGLSPDASQGLPFMLLEALRLQRQHLLAQKLPLKPFSISLLSDKNDSRLPKAAEALYEFNKQSHTAKVAHYLLDWQDHGRQLQSHLQQQPAAERNLLLLDPAGLTLPGLQELLLLLPKKLDILMVLPAQALQLAAGVPLKNPAPEEVQQLATKLPTLTPPAEEEPEPTARLIRELRQQLASSSNRLVMHFSPPEGTAPLLLFGVSTDTLMMEKMLQARYQLELLQARQLQTGAQLGLFGARCSAQAPAETNHPAAVLEHLFSQKPEWNNQELYKAILEQELSVQEAGKAVLALIEAGKVEVLDEKKKKQPAIASLSLSNTAFKLPAPSRFFRRKN